MPVSLYKATYKTMALYIQGIGWISTQARGPNEMISVLEQQAIVPKNDSYNAEIRHVPRLRRSGVISQFAWIAVQDALADAGKEWSVQEAAQTALIFLSTHGGICHTVRFFEGVAMEGTAAGSPIFFPETVYNAPPSHIAAQLGIDGMVTSLVGDSSAVGAAFCTAEEWFNLGICKQCLIVAAEEIHPLLQKAYSPILSKGSWLQKTFFSEAAAAVLLSRSPKGSAAHVHSDVVIRKGADLLASLRALFQETANGETPKIILTSAMEDHLRISEQTAMTQLWPIATHLHPKNQLGESFAASSLGNVVIGEALKRQGEVSPILISLLGTSGQASALLLTKNP